MDIDSSQLSIDDQDEIDKQLLSEQGRTLEISYDCWDCEKSFDSFDKKKRHEKLHLREFKCLEVDCKYHEIGFPNKADLYKHQSSVHKIKTTKTKVYECLIKDCKSAGRKTTRKDNILRHMKTKHNLFVKNDALRMISISTPSEAVEYTMQ
jgi:GTPase SAR1 family protein